MHNRVRIVKNELGGSAKQQELKGWGVEGSQWNEQGDWGLTPPPPSTPRQLESWCITLPLLFTYETRETTCCLHITLTINTTIFYLHFMHMHMYILYIYIDVANVQNFLYSYIFLTFATSMVYYNNTFDCSSVCRSVGSLILPSICSRIYKLLTTQTRIVLVWRHSRSPMPSHPSQSPPWFRCPSSLTYAVYSSPVAHEIAPSEEKDFTAALYLYMLHRSCFQWHPRFWNAANVIST